EAMTREGSQFSHSARSRCFPTKHVDILVSMTEANALQLTFRDLIEDDAAAVLDLVRSVLEVAKRTVTSREEFTISEVEERTYLRTFRTSGCNLALGAFHDERLLGVLFMEQLPKLRNRHRATLGMSVHPTMWSRKIGSRLLQNLLGRSEVLDCFHQLEASVLSNNVASQRIFRSAGFQQIGTVPEAVLLDGAYLDEILFVLKLR
ncbi:GNAT family N-acetyltransferase, partial [Granulicella sp. dw_53]|uniref:GNAT family N-acetyltransferase n=1 Tax=Granulicella sp. dw_53 TaxID=2719792 RepID=UPI001BD35DF3